ncbi:MAG: hypothetical protein HQ574_09000 [Chloroflexi bacterium]|nr:hypothetical protein [Chloroflexota bacterium]
MKLSEVMNSARTTITLGFLKHEREKGETRTAGGVVITSAEGSFLVTPTGGETGDELEIQPLGPALWKQWICANTEIIQVLDSE